MMKPLPRRLLITGILICVLAPLAGFLFTVLGMVGAFHALGDNGITDPKILSDHIATTLIATMTGLVVGAVGLLLVIAAAVLQITGRPTLPPPTR